MGTTCAAAAALLRAPSIDLLLRAEVNMFFFFLSLSQVNSDYAGGSRSNSFFISFTMPVYVRAPSQKTS